MCRLTFLGAVYTSDFKNELPYDSVYDFLHKVISDLIFNWIVLKFVDKRL
jgi:hypothetical protein